MKQRLHMPATLKVNEIFYSLQGEGANSGQPMIFIRLAGCNRSCTFCDTNHSDYEEFTLEQLLEKISIFPASWINWTGGEPALQLSFYHIDYFSSHGFRQSIETNGSLPVPAGLDYITISPKGKVFLSKANEVRFIIRSGDTIPQTAINANHYYLSPENPDHHKRNLNHAINLCLENPKWKLSTQNHMSWLIR